MGRGMASHTSWRARVTAGGAGWGGAGERVGKEPGRRGHRSQEMGGENAFFHHGATGGSTWSNSGECGPRSVASPRTAAERSWLASAAVTPGGASLQVWECCRARYPPAKPHTGPGSSQQKGILLLPTHLATVSCSPLFFPSPHPGIGGHLGCCQRLAGPTMPVCPSVPESLDLPQRPNTTGRRALGSPSCSADPKPHWALLMQRPPERGGTY